MDKFNESLGGRIAGVAVRVRLFARLVAKSHQKLLSS
jgi:hypothetical protein